MDSGEIEKELARVWERMASAQPPEPASAAFAEDYIPPDAPSITREASDEVIALVKRQGRGEAARLGQLLELKDRMLAELRARFEAAQVELETLRRRASREEEIVYDKIYSVSLELEAAREAVASQERTFREEEKLLRSVAEETRRQLAAEAARFRDLEREWGEREQAYLLQLGEQRAAAARAGKEAARHESLARRASLDLASAKSAIEAALAELLRERNDRAAAAQERDGAKARLKSLEERMAELTMLWEEERRQWREVTDRGRLPSGPPQGPVPPAPPAEDKPSPRRGFRSRVREGLRGLLGWD